MESYWKAWAWPSSHRGGSGRAKQVLCDEEPLRGGRVSAAEMGDDEQTMLVAVCCDEEGGRGVPRESLEGRTRDGRDWRAEGDGLANRHDSADKWISLAPPSALGNSKNTTSIQK